MTKKMKEFLKRLASNEYIPEDELKETADALLKEEMTEQILGVFGRVVKHSEVKEALNNNNKVDFIQAFRYYPEQSNYLNENFDELDFIMEVLKEELEKESENE